MSKYNQLEDLPCNADMPNVTKDTCFENVGVPVAIIVQKQVGASPFSAVGSALTETDDPATWATALALPDSDVNKLVSMAFEFAEADGTGGEAQEEDFPDGTSRLTITNSYDAEVLEGMILRPSDQLEDELGYYRSLNDKLRFWILTEKNVLLGNFYGFDITSFQYVLSAKFRRTQADKGALTVKYLRVPSLNDVSKVSSATASAILA